MTEGPTEQTWRSEDHLFDPPRSKGILWGGQVDMEDWGTSAEELAERERHELAQEIKLRERVRAWVQKTRQEQGMPEQLVIEMHGDDNG